MASLHLRKSWWPDLAVVSLLVALPVLFFWRVLIPIGSSRWVFAYGDFVEQYYPLRLFAAGELKRGRLPLWNPHIYSGTPALADIQSAALYPVAALSALVTGRPDLPFYVLEAEALLHFGFAGAFTYLFARRLLGDWRGALVTALAFTYGGYLTAYPSLQLTILEVSVWLPLILLLLDWGCEGWTGSEGVRRILFAGVTLAIALWAGHPQTFIYLLYAAAAFLIFRAHGHGLGVRQMLAILALWLGMGGTLSAIQWLPTWELVRYTARATLSYAEASSGLLPRELAGILLPARGSGWSPLYVGIVPLLLSGAALAWKRSRDTLFWAGLSLVALLLAMGRHGFVYGFFYRWIPGFGLFRQQERAAYLFSFALAVLAGYGFVALQERHGEKQFHGLSFSGPAFTLGVAAIILVDLFMANGGKTLEPARAGGYFPVTATVRALEADQDRPFRISSEGLLPADGNASIVYGVQDVVGNSPLHLAGYEKFLDEVQEYRWWQLLNVRYVLTQRELSHGALALIAESEDGARLYQFYNGLPRAWIVHHAVSAADQQEAWQLVNKPDFDARQTVVLEEIQAPDPPFLASPREGEASDVVVDLNANTAPASSARSAAEIVSYEPGRIVMETELESEGMLVLSEIFYPGWKAYVNGEAVKIQRANGLLRALPLSRGKWQIEMIYDPTSFKAGLGVTLAGAMAAAVIYVWPGWVRP